MPRGSASSSAHAGREDSDAPHAPQRGASPGRGGEPLGLRGGGRGGTLRTWLRYTGSVTLRALLLALCAIIAGASPVRAQPCSPTVPDGTLCDDDLDPCTDDRCDDGVCKHTAVGFVVACRPVVTPFQRLLVLAPFTAQLTARIAGLPVGDPPAFTSGQRAALVDDLTTLGTELETSQRILGGRDEAADDTAQGRAVAALPSADDAMHSAALVRSLVRAAIRADQFTPATASELERSTADLLRGTKAVTRDLRRLRKVSQVFQP